MTQTDKLYTGQQQEPGDALGLYDYKARFYSTVLGRFLGVDPVAGSVADPQSWNAYAYVRNNPLRYSDPTGQRWDSGLFDGAGAVRVGRPDEHGGAMGVPACAEVDAPATASVTATAAAASTAPAVNRCDAGRWCMVSGRSAAGAAGGVCIVRLIGGGTGAPGGVA